MTEHQQDVFIILQCHPVPLRKAENWLNQPFPFPSQDKAKTDILNFFPGSLPAPTPDVEVVPDGVERGVPLGARHHGRHGADQRVVDERRESLRVAEKNPLKYDV